jgi:hypothetical protein
VKAVTWVAAADAFPPAVGAAVASALRSTTWVPRAEWAEVKSLSRALAEVPWRAAQEEEAFPLLLAELLLATEEPRVEGYLLELRPAISGAGAEAREALAEHCPNSSRRHANPEPWP